MNSHCTHCTLPTIEYYLTCKTCPSSFHYSCLHPSSIISRSWTHLNNPPPAYQLLFLIRLISPSPAIIVFQSNPSLALTNFLLPIQTLSLPPLSSNAIPNLNHILPPPNH